MSNQAEWASMAPGDGAAASWHADAGLSDVGAGAGALALAGADDLLDEEALDGVEEDLDDDELDEDDDEDDEDDEDDDDELDEFEDDELDDDDDDDDDDEIDFTTERSGHISVLADEGG
ncbi:MAG: hypothetical protein H7305_05110 [Gemmatimonadaceae bacterium]|nr:hypothetical protein [Gemmatimonadaceae bacterium]